MLFIMTSFTFYSYFPVKLRYGVIFLTKPTIVGINGANHVRIPRKNLSEEIKVN